MKRFLRCVVWLLVSLLLILGVVLLLKDAIIKSIAERRIRHKTGLDVRIGGVRVGLFSPTVALQDFRAFNPPGYGGAMLLDVPTASCLLDWPQLKTNRLHFNELSLRLAELNVIKRQDGVVNLESVKETILTNIFKERNKKKWIFKFAGIDRLDLTLDKVNYTDYQQPANSLQFNVGITNEIITNLRTEQDFNQWLNAFLIRIAFQEYMKNPRLKASGLDMLSQGMNPFQIPKLKPSNPAANTNIPAVAPPN